MGLQSESFSCHVTVTKPKHLDRSKKTLQPNKPRTSYFYRTPLYISNRDTCLCPAPCLLMIRFLWIWLQSYSAKYSTLQTLGIFCVKAMQMNSIPRRSTRGKWPTVSSYNNPDSALSQRNTRRIDQRHSAIKIHAKIDSVFLIQTQDRWLSTNELHSVNWQIRTCSLLSHSYAKTSTRIHTAPVMEQLDSSWQNQTCDSLGWTRTACNIIFSYDSSE